MWAYTHVPHKTSYDAGRTASGRPRGLGPRRLRALRRPDAGADREARARLRLADPRRGASWGRASWSRATAASSAARSTAAPPSCTSSWCSVRCRARAGRPPGSRGSTWARPRPTPAAACTARAARTPRGRPCWGRGCRGCEDDPMPTRLKLPTGGSSAVDADRLYDLFTSLGHRAGPGALRAPGRGGHRAAQRRQRHPGHPDRLGEVAGRDRGALRGDRHRPRHVLHRAHQGAGEREVLHPLRRLRRRERRHADRRRLGEPRRADHLLHRGDPGPPGAARGPGRRRRAGRDGRVPLLLRARPRLGLAGAAAGAAAGAVPADVGHARPGRPLRRGPDGADRAPDLGRRRRRATGAAELHLGRHPARRDGRGAGEHPPGPGVRRALHPGQRRGARDEPEGGSAEPARHRAGGRRGEGADRRGDR